MRWSMPIFALALAIALGALSPPPVRHGQAPLPAISLASFSLFSSAEATTLEAGRTGCVAAPAPAASVATSSDNALLWAASLRGWSEGPTVRAWRRFVTWTKQGWRQAPCGTAQASLG